MNESDALMIQSVIDGEARASEAPRVELLLSQDPNAQRVAASLRATKELLKTNEPSVALEESREFYWTKIEKAICKLEIEKASAPRRRTWGWMPWLAPVGGLVAAFALAWGVWLHPATRKPAHVTLAIGHEVDTPLPHLTAYTFRSEANGMTVVWVETH